MFQQPQKVCYGVDVVPILSQGKCLVAWMIGDHDRCRETWDKYTTYSIGASQVLSISQLLAGRYEEAKQTQLEFLRGVALVPYSFPYAAARSLSIIAGGSFAKVLVPAAPFAAAAVSGMLVGRLWNGKIVVKDEVEMYETAVMVSLDALRGMIGAELLSMFYYHWPDHITRIDVYAYPLQVKDMMRLAVKTEPPPFVGDVDAPFYHAYAVLTTQKGQHFAVERLHDGTVQWQHLENGNALAFKGGTLSREGAAAPSDMPHGGHTLAFGKDLPSEGNTSLTINAVQRVAMQESNLAYDLATANCQHFARDLYDALPGKHVATADLPNGWWLQAVSLLKPASELPVTVTPTPLSMQAYEATTSTMMSMMKYFTIAGPLALSASLDERGRSSAAADSRARMVRPCS